MVKNMMPYKIGNLNNTVIFGKERMNTNVVKKVVIDNKTNSRYDDNELGM